MQNKKIGIPKIIHIAISNASTPENKFNKIAKGTVDKTKNLCSFQPLQ